MKKLFCQIPRSLQWGILFGFCLLFAGMSFAMMINVTSKTTGEILTAEDFNQIPEALMGIENINGDIGIGTGAVSGVKLSVGGMIRTRPSSYMYCTNAMKGGIYFNQTDKHFYTCRGNALGWAQMDN